MREIKFRGKSSKTGWEYGRLLRLLPRYGSHADAILDEDGRLHRIDSETVGQYTGMKDSNKTEIYEGDIVSVNNDYELAEISWENCKFVVCQGDVMNDFGEYQSYELEVVGNIYDNPEMLDGDAGSESGRK